MVGGTDTMSAITNNKVLQSLAELFIGYIFQIYLSIPDLGSKGQKFTIRAK